MWTSLRPARRGRLFGRRLARGIAGALTVSLVASFGPALASSAAPASVIDAAAAPVPAASVASAAAAPTRRKDADLVKPKTPTTTFTTSDRVVPVRTGRSNDIEIGIDTRLYVPQSASRRRPAPAILMSHGFGGSKDSTEVLTTAAFFASHGYVVLTYSASGFGKSGGCVTLHSADYDVKSSKQLLDTVLEPRRDVLHDRRGVVVGTIGGSYGGGAQLPLAALDKRVKTSIVGRSWNNLAFSLNPNNRIVPGDRTGLEHGRNLQGVFKMEWTSLFYALGNAQPVMGNGGCPQAKIASQNPVEIAASPNCPGFYLELCAVYTELAVAGTTSAGGRTLIARASASNYLAKLKKPVLLIQGQSDTLFNLNDAAATYTALKRRGVPVGMIWNSGGHGGYTSQPGECEAYDGIDRSISRMSNCYLPLRSLGWMDHWLRGTKGGRGPEFTYYRDWVKYGARGPNDEQYAKATSFPLPKITRFTLTGTKTMRPRTGRVKAGQVSFINPEGGQPAAYSETSQFSGPDASPNLARQPTEIAGQHVAFTSTRLRRRLPSIGIPAARLDITNSNGRDLVFFAKIYDVDRNGRAELVHRLISPVRVPASEVGKPVTFAFTGFAHRFARGHRVRIVLASTDSTSYNAKTADTITVRTGKQSVFVLPGKMKG
ncbi:hypothetical protein GCM10027020_25230 [Nocardioides salsibiostraticola]